MLQTKSLTRWDLWWKAPFSPVGSNKMEFTASLHNILLCVRAPCPPQPCSAGRAHLSSLSDEGEARYPLLSSPGTDRALLLQHFHLPEENSPWGFILGLLLYDLRSCRGGCSWGLSLERDSRVGRQDRDPGSPECSWSQIPP